MTTASKPRRLCERCGALEWRCFLVDGTCRMCQAQLRDTKDQPRSGDTIVHCGHVGLTTGPVAATHWFKYDESLHFSRPDGSRGQAEWLVICEPCFLRHGGEAPVRGDATWIGDAPIIEQEVQN